MSAKTAWTDAPLAERADTADFRDGSRHKVAARQPAARSARADRTVLGGTV